EAPTILATTGSASQKRIEEFEKRGIEVWVLKSNGNGRVDVEDLLKEAGRREITSILVEGGAEIFAAFLPFGDKLLYFIAPKIYGNGTPAFGDPLSGQNRMSASGGYSLSQCRWEQVGEDLLVEGYLKK
ncbi:dihydrofolate reductase family protein, partial [candidate division TA06 bacterium]|nr:dihydrofolate reductase family protein [candidate division TA06 bacterium]